MDSILGGYKPCAAASGQDPRGVFVAIVNAREREPHCCEAAPRVVALELECLLVSYSPLAHAALFTLQRAEAAAFLA